MKCFESARIVLSDQEIAKPLSSLCPLWLILLDRVLRRSAQHHPSMGTGKILKGLTGLVFSDLTRSWIPGAISGWRA